MTSRPPYVPQLAQARCGRCWAPHWLHAAVIGAATFHCALRRRVRERDIFFFGTAMGPSLLESVSWFQEIPKHGKGRAFTL